MTHIGKINWITMEATKNGFYNVTSDEVNEALAGDEHALQPIEYDYIMELSKEWDQGLSA